MMGGSGQFGRRDTDSLGAGKQIGFMIGKKAEKGCQHRWVFEAGSQFARIQSGKGQQPLRPVLILQHPAERLQGDDFAVGS